MRSTGVLALSATPGEDQKTKDCEGCEQHTHYGERQARTKEASSDGADLVVVLRRRGRGGSRQQRSAASLHGLIADVAPLQRRVHRGWLKCLDESRDWDVARAGRAREGHVQRTESVVSRAVLELETDDWF